MLCRQQCGHAHLHSGLEYPTIPFGCFHGIDIILVNKIILYIGQFSLYCPDSQSQEGPNCKDAPYLHVCLQLGVGVVKKIRSDWDSWETG